jgi:hypothetical protein
MKSDHDRQLLFLFERPSAQFQGGNGKKAQDNRYDPEPDHYL